MSDGPSFIRAGHGAGRGQPRVEVPPFDEASDPVPAPPAAATGPVERRRDGTVAGSAAGKALGRRGGLQTARSVRLVDSLGLSKVVEQTSFGPYRTAAEAFVKHHLECLATMAGGSVGPAPSSMVASAALQLAASRWAFDRGAEANDSSLIKLGSTLANDSRQNLLASYQLAVLEAKARPAANERPFWLVEDGHPDAQTQPAPAPVDGSEEPDPEATP